MGAWVDIGGARARSLIVSRFWLDGGSMFGQVPKTLWSRFTSADEANRIPLVVRSLLIQSGERLVLVDPGMGGDYPSGEREQMRLDESLCDLAAVLIRGGVEPRDVTDVIITHLHFDHVAGLGRKDSDGVVRSVLPNARVFVQKAHWERAQAPGPKERRSFQSRDLDLLRVCDLVLLEGDGEPVPGVRVRVSEGHTRAQQWVTAQGSRATVIHAADLIPTLAHIRAAYTMGFDLRPEDVISEKDALLAEAAERDAILVFAHDPRTAACRVARGRNGYVVRLREPDWE